MVKLAPALITSLILKYGVIFLVLSMVLIFLKVIFTKLGFFKPLAKLAVWKLLLLMGLLFILVFFPSCALIQRRGRRQIKDLIYNLQHSESLNATNRFYNLQQNHHVLEETKVTEVGKIKRLLHHLQNTTFVFSDDTGAVEVGDWLTLTVFQNGKPSNSFTIRGPLLDIDKDERMYRYFASDELLVQHAREILGLNNP